MSANPPAARNKSWLKVMLLFITSPSPSHRLAPIRWRFSDLYCQGGGRRACLREAAPSAAPPSTTTKNRGLLQFVCDIGLLLIGTTLFVEGSRTDAHSRGHMPLRYRLLLGPKHSVSACLKLESLLPCARALSFVPSMCPVSDFVILGRRVR